MTSYQNLAIIILAAGNSSRMGSPKQLLSIGDKTLLEHTVACATASQLSNIFVILGSNAEQHQDILSGKAIDILVNQEWMKGMGSSVKFGVKKVMKKQNNVQAIMLLVCDQPQLTSDHINTLADLYFTSKPKAIASRYMGTYGVPAVFDKTMFPDLISINDQAGARSLLTKMEKELKFIPFEGGEIDLDTPKDYEQFISRKR